MGKLKWYKRDPDAAISGMMNLTLEERGAYNTVLDLIYSHDGKVRDNDRFLSGVMCCDPRVWRRIRARLIEMGKLTLEDGHILNPRATREVGRALHRVAVATELGARKGHRSAPTASVSNDLFEADEPKTARTTTTTTRKEDKKDSRVFEFESFWGAYPRRDGANPRAPAAKKFGSLIASGVDPQAIISGASRYALECKTKRIVRTSYVAQAIVFLNQRRWEDYAPAAAPGANLVSDDPQSWPRSRWIGNLKEWRITKVWRRGWGPEPGYPGCMVPADLLTSNEH